MREFCTLKKLLTFVADLESQMPGVRITQIKLDILELQDIWYVYSRGRMPTSFELKFQDRCLLLRHRALVLNPFN